MEFALRTTGPILEVGAGLFSTPVLHGFCKRNKRLLYTVERDPEWLAKFEEYKSDFHVISPEEPPLDWFSLALIDGPEDQRVWWIDQWGWRIEYLILHDADPGHKYPTDFFIHKRTDQRLIPRTMVVSHFSSVEADCGCGGKHRH